MTLAILLGLGVLFILVSYVMHWIIETNERVDRLETEQDKLRAKVAHNSIHCVQYGDDE